jgi:beta-lactamase class D
MRFTARVRALMVLCLASTIHLSSVSNLTNQDINLQKYFQEYQVEGSFILYDEAQDKLTRYNAQRCKALFSPASTFKIPNSLIALEEGSIEDENTIIRWNREEWHVQAWNQDLSLKDAFRLSCVPCYIQLAEKIGEEKYQQYLSKIHYGNEDAGGSRQNAFWLDGNLRISQEQQIDFLRKLYHEQLPVSKRSMAIVRKILKEEETEEYILSGKTGWNNELHNRDIGWYVGYLEKSESVYFFATNIESQKALDNFGEARKAITINILKELGLI